MVLGKMQEKVGNIFLHGQLKAKLDEDNRSKGNQNKTLAADEG